MQLIRFIKALLLWPANVAYEAQLHVEEMARTIQDNER